MENMEGKIRHMLAGSGLVYRCGYGEKVGCRYCKAFFFLSVVEGMYPTHCIKYRIIIHIVWGEGPSVRRFKGIVEKKNGFALKSEGEDDDAKMDSR